MSKEKEERAQGTCFVVMGFGKKTDFETGRTLDLDKTYKNIIKPAVEEAGLKCVRADDIIHSGPIDVPMYEQLLSADVVVADLSTSNKNAYYELGVRHALKPYTTIIICENGVTSLPFDLNHVVIRTYQHLGDGHRLRRGDAVPQSPHRSHRRNLQARPGEAEGQPRLHVPQPAQPAGAEEGDSGRRRGGGGVVARVGGGGRSARRRRHGAAKAKLYSEWMSEVDAAQSADDFEEAKSLLKLLRKKMKPKPPRSPDQPTQPEDPYIIQRLALVTYKAKQKTPEDGDRRAQRGTRPARHAQTRDLERHRDARPLGRGA